MAYAVNIIVFGEEGILIFSLYEVNKLRTVVLEKRKDDALIRPRLQFPIFRATIEYKTVQYLDVRILH